LSYSFSSDSKQSGEKIVATVTTEHRGKTLILHISGSLSFDEIACIIKTHCPAVTCHVICNLTNVSVDSSVTYENLCTVPELARNFMPCRDPKGKTAHVSADSSAYGVQYLFSVILEHDGSTRKKGLFKSLEEATDWLNE
jgi:hypothetical protein